MPPPLTLQWLVPKQWAHHPPSCIPVFMQLRRRIHLSNSCPCFIDWKINSTPFIFPFPSTTFSFRINASFLQLSTGRGYFKLSKSSVLVGKELRVCRLLMIKAPENANGHRRCFLSIKTDPTSGKLEVDSRPSSPPLRVKLAWDGGRVNKHLVSDCEFKFGPYRSSSCGRLCTLLICEMGS